LAVIATGTGVFYFVAHGTYFLIVPLRRNPCLKDAEKLKINFAALIIREMKSWYMSGENLIFEPYF
jgi:hypothetical protein